MLVVAMLTAVGCKNQPAARPSVQVDSLCRTISSEIERWAKDLADPNVTCAQLARTSRLALGYSLGTYEAIEAVVDTDAKSWVADFQKATMQWASQGDTCLDLDDATVRDQNVRNAVEQARGQIELSRKGVLAHCGNATPSK
jgi:hypothetical protein